MYTFPTDSLTTKLQQTIHKWFGVCVRAAPNDVDGTNKLRGKRSLAFANFMTFVQLSYLSHLRVARIENYFRQGGNGTRSFHLLPNLN